MVAVFKKVFSKPRYLLIASSVSLAIFTFAVWLPNWHLIVILLSSPAIEFVDAVNVMLSLFLSISTNFTLFSATYTIVIAVLFGLNIALLSYYIKTRKSDFNARSGVYSAGGLMAGVFGIGCAACGTFILSSVLAIFGMAGIISFLPFQGGEFGIIGVLLIGYATYWTIKKIDEPLVCRDSVMK